MVNFALTRRWLCMVCPKCNSTDMKKLSLVYAAGVYESRGRMGGFLLGRGEAFLLGRYKGTSQSRLSKLVRPPGNVPYIVPVILWLVCFFPVMAIAGRETLSWSMGMFAVGYVLLLPCKFSALSSTTYSYVRTKSDSGNDSFCASAVAQS